MKESDIRHHAARMYALAKILEANGERHLMEWPLQAAQALTTLADEKHAATSSGGEQ